MFKDRETSKHNPHPTVKPIKLTQHLAALLLPPAAYAPRRLFVPFSGSGSEMIGACLAGWEFVQGVEMEAEYADIARARLRYWTGYTVTRTTERVTIERETVTETYAPRARAQMALW